MRGMSAHDAKARFGQLLDAARSEPVMIKKHGRGVAVLVSKEEFDALQQVKLQQLRSEIQIGLDAIESGDFVEIDAGEIRQFAESIKSAGRARKSGK
jgi:prevent-host-death family protein